MFARGDQRRVRELENKVQYLEQQLEERIKEIDEANKALRKLATVDGLTGIPNHRHFRDFLETEWRRSARDHAPLSVIMIDIDYFKTYNDSFGHQAGDECLRRVATALTDGVGRPGDLVARYGGEEFVAVLGATDHDGALVLAERLRVRVEALGLPHPRSLCASVVTVSGGVASIFPQVDGNPDELVGEADRALYRSKREGRNRMALPPPVVNTPVAPGTNGEILPFPVRRTQ